MRLIDADALEELFREVIAGIAKRGEVAGALEHMVRASAMTVQMIQDAPTVELTDEAAIEHLQATGWMQNHDREMSRPHWIPFRRREPDVVERELHPGWEFVFDCPLPDDKQVILVSNGRSVWEDEWFSEACEPGQDFDDGLCSGHEIKEGWAWMPLPEPPERIKA